MFIGKRLSQTFYDQLDLTLSEYLGPAGSFYVWASACKGRNIRKLMRGAGEVQKKYSRKGKLNEKNSF